MGNLGPWEILIIAGVIILLFGARKMPEMARSLGKSARILKAETKGMRSDEAQAQDEAAPTLTAKPEDKAEVDKLRQQLEAAEAEVKVEAPKAEPVEQQANKNVG